jgi:hypothetical protein
MEFLSSPADRDIHSERAMLIPSRTISNYFYDALRETLGMQLEAIRSRTKAEVFHLVPPPPKEDNDFIRMNCEARFRELGIEELGPTRPSLRLKAWKLQLGALEQLCSELAIRLIGPPPVAVTKTGFLHPEFYANDATHANRRYGREALKEVLRLAVSSSDASSHSAASSAACKEMSRAD